jgi:hypothetical protein
MMCVFITAVMMLNKWCVYCVYSGGLPQITAKLLREAGRPTWDQLGRWSRCATGTVPRGHRAAGATHLSLIRLLFQTRGASCGTCGARRRASLSPCSSSPSSGWCVCVSVCVCVCVCARARALSLSLSLCARGRCTYVYVCVRALSLSLSTRG